MSTAIDSTLKKAGIQFISILPTLVSFSIPALFDERSIGSRSRQAYRKMNRIK